MFVYFVALITADSHWGRLYHMNSEPTQFVQSAFRTPLVHSIFDTMYTLYLAYQQVHVHTNTFAHTFSATAYRNEIICLFLLWLFCIFCFCCVVFFFLRARTFVISSTLFISCFFVCVRCAYRLSHFEYTHVKILLPIFRPCMLWNVNWLNEIRV